MVMEKHPTISRSFPEAREFLQAEIAGPGYPVKHLIEQARNKGYITRGKRGRGGGVVTSLDMAVLLTAILAGDTPQEASDALSDLIVAMPHPFFDGDDDKLEGLKDGWWDYSLTQVIAGLIDAWRDCPNLNIGEIIFKVYRSPRLQSEINWMDLPPPGSPETTFETRHITYRNEVTDGGGEWTGCREIAASFDGLVLKLVADWLEGNND